MQGEQGGGIWVNDPQDQTPVWVPDGTNASDVVRAAREARASPPEPSITTPTSPPQSKGLWWKVVSIGLGVALFAWGAVALTENIGKPSDSASTRSTSPTVVADYGPDIPRGYDDLGNGLAYKWTTGKGSGCSYFDSCVTLDLYAYWACPTGVYIEANVLNTGGSIIGFTNDTVAQMRAEDKAEIVLGSMDANAEKFRLTDASCY